MINLNKKFLLDKGYIALFKSHLSGPDMSALQGSLFKDKVCYDLIDVGSATFIIKSPLFVKLNMAASRFNLSFIDIPSTELDSYIPSVPEIGCQNIADSEEVRAYIEQTSQALLINSQSMPKDGADPFIGQVMVPISLYVEFIAHGSLRSWAKFLNQNKLPKMIETYRSAIEEQMSVEWKNIIGIKRIA